ncbi:uncharacterized protein KRP23_13752 [Phytophthora ramorum]|uniref:uncharacterized protein n=1 Tax=Phytophthora ramorum TaxID=164328 RepID=UPI0030A2F6B9|nr:hypothetical protein KRP23_13752 [Phytophthora ramorum]
MPMATPATESVKPFVLIPVTDIDAKKERTNTFCQDGWLEKVFDRQDGAKPLEPQKHKHNFIQRALESLTHHHSSKEKSGGPAIDENSYREELQKYIAESSENLRYDEEDEPLGSSDEDTSDEDSDSVSISPRNAEIIDFSASIVSISEYVVPPVEVPRSYRTQDRQGGVVVAGSRVLFTNWAFKRQLRHMGRLGPLPERSEMASYEMPNEDDGVSVGMYSGKIVEL